MRDRRARDDNERGREREREAMKYRMPFLLLLLLPLSSKVAVVSPAFVRQHAAFPSLSDSSLNRKSNYTPIILPCQILNSVGESGAAPPPNSCSYPGEREREAVARKKGSEGGVRVRENERAFKNERTLNAPSGIRADGGRGRGRREPILRLASSALPTSRC